MAVMNDAVQKIKDRLSIIDVVSPYVELHKAGRNFKGKSPFSNERTPSFYVSPDRGMYYCFSTSQGGDMFNFIQAMEGVDFRGALTMLAEKAGVELVPEPPQKKNERDRLYALLAEATEFYQTVLQKNSEAQAYLEKRGVKAETIKRWQIGYAPGPTTGGWRVLKEYLSARGYTNDELLKAGLIKVGGSGKEPFDVFRDRIVFPLRDQGGRVVAFSGRILVPSETAPKYVNSPETELYKKSELLYGYDLAKNTIRTLDFSLIVEGQFDVVLCHQAGYTNTVAVSGTALTIHHVQVLERLSNKVVLALDADKAGVGAVKRSAELMLKRGMDVKVATMPGGSDPADLIQKEVASFKKVIGSSVHVVEFLLNVLKNETKDERTYKLRAREEIIPFVTLIPNRIDQEHFETILATMLNTTKEAIHFEVERVNEREREVSKQRSGTSVAPANHTPEPTPQLSAQSRQQSLLTQLCALATSCDQRRQAILFTEIERLTGMSKEQALLSVSQDELARATFILEQEITKASQKTLDADIIHALNQLRQVIIRTALQEQKQALKDLEHTGLLGQEDVLKEIAQLEIRLREAPYTETLLTP